MDVVGGEFGFGGFWLKNRDCAVRFRYGIGELDELMVAWFFVVVSRHKMGLMKEVAIAGVNASVGAAC